MKISYAKVLIAVVVSLVAGVVGSIFTYTSIGWYQTLAKSFFTPPGWIFASVWTALFVLMGIAAGLVWSIKNKNNSLALAIFSVQLVLNVLWSYLFFGLRSPYYALAEVIFLWAAVLATVFFFYKISRKAGLLLIPYICWISFAIPLNLYIVVLN